MRTRNFDEWTIDRWRTEPRLRMAEIEIEDAGEKSPPLWKDLTVASVIAMVLWAMAVIVLV